MLEDQDNLSSFSPLRWSEKALILSDCGFSASRNINSLSSMHKFLLPFTFDVFSIRVFWRARPWIQKEKAVEDDAEDADADIAAMMGFGGFRSSKKWSTRCEEKWFAPSQGSSNPIQAVRLYRRWRMMPRRGGCKICWNRRRTEGALHWLVWPCLWCGRPEEPAVPPCWESLSTV